MAVEPCLFVTRLIVYCILWIFSFICFIPLCIVIHLHQGYCLLYADNSAYGPLPPCGYTITVPIIFSHLYPAYMVVSYICKINFYNKYGYVEETLSEFVLTIIMDGLSWIFMFVNSSIISAGFNDMCWNIFGSIETCSQGSLVQELFGRDTRFYVLIKMAEVAAWLSWLLWLLQLIIGISILRRSGLLPNCSLHNLMCQIMPCHPHCTCSCKLHFNRLGRQTNKVPSPQEAVTNV